MGIDIYAHWKGQTGRERDAQQTGFSTVHGHVGYLREAYHGGPYVTRYLVRECFEAPKCEAAIASAELRKRLPIAVLMTLYRHMRVYGENETALRRRLEADPAKVAEAVMALFAPGGEIEQARSGEEGDTFARTVDMASIKACNDAIAARTLPEFALAFVDFVDLCERKERETGFPCRVYASY